MTRVAVFLVVASVLVTTAGASQVFTDETAFLAAIPTPYSESFEKLPATNTLNLQQIMAYGFTISAPTGPDLGVFDEPASWGGHATDGVQWVGHQTGTGELTVFDFDEPTNVFGFWWSDWGDWGSGNLQFANDANPPDEVVVMTTPQPNGGDGFWGIYNPNSTFTHVELLNTVSGEAYGIDQVYFTPEPTAFLLVGLGGLLLRRR